MLRYLAWVTVSTVTLFIGCWLAVGFILGFVWFLNASAWVFRQGIIQGVLFTCIPFGLLIGFIAWDWTKEESK